MSAVSGITIIELTNSDIWDKYNLYSYGPKVDEKGGGSFFKKITLYIPESYLSPDKDAKIKGIIHTIIQYNRDLHAHQRCEKRFLISQVGGGNTAEVTSYIEHISSFSTILQKMKDFLSKNNIIYNLEY